MSVYLRWAVLGMTLALAACAAGPRAGSKTGGSPEAIVEQRAKERWAYLVDNNFHAAYEYLTPGYRATRTVQSYAAGAKPAILSWKGVQWRGVDCETPESCVAKLILEYTVQMQGAGTVPGLTEIKERWMLLDGTWYHLPER
jgi:hypothetical protein